MFNIKEVFRKKNPTMHLIFNEKDSKYLYLNKFENLRTRYFTFRNTKIEDR